MFIQNPVWKSVPASLLEEPVWEGTVLTENGEIVWDSSTGGESDSSAQIQSVGPADMLRSSAPAQEPYGIVPETIYVLPPTMMINVAVGGTIDLTLPGNEAMENFPKALADELGADFNFVRHNEHTGGSGGSGDIPAYSAEDDGKVLSVVSTPTKRVVVEDEIVRFNNGTAQLLGEYSFDGLSEGDYVSVTLGTTEYPRCIVEAGENDTLYIHVASEPNIVNIYSDGHVSATGGLNSTIGISAYFYDESQTTASLEWKAAEGGGSSSGGLVEIKNVEPFQVPDLVNGGTRLFDPVNDSLYFVPHESGIYTEIDKFFVSNETPPGILYDTGKVGLIGFITKSWFEIQAYEKLGAEKEPQFCVAPSSFYVVLTDDFNGFIVKPENIVYNYIRSDEAIE